MKLLLLTYALLFSVSYFVKEKLDTISQLEDEVKRLTELQQLTTKRLESYNFIIREKEVIIYQLEDEVKRLSKEFERNSKYMEGYNSGLSTMIAQRHNEEPTRKSGISVGLCIGYC